MRIDIDFLVHPFFLLIVLFLFLQNTLKYRKHRGDDSRGLTLRIVLNSLVYFLLPVAIWLTCRHNAHHPHDKIIVVAVALAIATWHLWSVRRVIDGKSGGEEKGK